MLEPPHVWVLNGTQYHCNRCWKFLHVLHIKGDTFLATSKIMHGALQSLGFQTGLPLYFDLIVGYSSLYQHHIPIFPSGKSYCFFSFLSLSLHESHFLWSWLPSWMTISIGKRNNLKWLDWCHIFKGKIHAQTFPDL